MESADDRVRVLQSVWNVYAQDNNPSEFALVTDEVTRAAAGAARQGGRWWDLVVEPGDGLVAVSQINPTALRTRRKSGAAPLSSDALGYAFSVQKSGTTPISSEYARPSSDFKHTPQAFLGYAYNRALGIARHDNRQTVVFVSGSVTHTLGFNLDAGGYVDSWVVNGPQTSSSDVEILSRGDNYMRGIQGCSEWVDAALGEMTRNHPVQGGSYYSHVQFDPLVAQGAPLLSFTEEDPVEGGHKITIRCIPIDLDPDGRFAVAGVRSNHGGSIERTALWKDMTFELELWLDWRGHQNWHRLIHRAFFPDPILGAYLDMASWTAINLHAAPFTQVRSLELPAGTDSQLSDGIFGNAGFLAHYRRYAMNNAARAADDEGKSIGASTIATGRGAIAATGALATNFAVACAANASADAVSGTDRSLSEFPHGNEWTWAQSKQASAGHDGDDVIYLAKRSCLTGRWHPNNSLRRIPAGSLRVECFLATDTWANIKTDAAGVLGQALSFPA